MTTHKHTPACTCTTRSISGSAYPAISFCPMHASAPALLAELERGMWGDTFSNSLRGIAALIENDGSRTAAEALRAKADRIEDAIKLATGEKGGGA